MNRNSEKYLERSLKAQVEEARGGLCIKLLPFQMAGLPDRMILLRGRAFFAEIKTLGKTLRPIQKIVHKMFAKVGFDVWVIDREEVLQDFLKHIDETV